jgi:hypothetical protein
MDRLDCCIGRNRNDNFVSISLICASSDVVCDGGWRSSRLCFPPELGSIQKIALARFWRVDHPSACGSGFELVCGLITQFIGNWSLVIGHWLGISITDYPLPITDYPLPKESFK